MYQCIPSKEQANNADQKTWQNRQGLILTLVYPVKEPSGSMSLMIASPTLSIVSM